MTDLEDLPQGAEEASGDDWRAPYVPYTTLVNLLDNKLGSNPLPPRIDRGFLDSYAGSVQAMLLATLRTIGLIDDAGRVTPVLKEATRSPALRKKILREWAETFYAEQQALADQNATAQMLHESFARHRLSGSTLRKAVVFYLALVEDVGLAKSPHFRAPRAVNNGASRKKKAPVQTTESSSTASSTVAPTGEVLRVDLGEAGSVTVTVDVRWLQLPIDKFTKLRSVIAELETLAAGGSDAAEAPPEDATAG